MPDAPRPIEIFFAYAHEDELLRKELEKHLSLLQRQGLITGWYDRLVAPGTDWTQAVDKHLEQASVILLLISADFLASDYCYGVEMQQALKRHQAKGACVIPILLRPVVWKGAPFEHLQALPTDGRAITEWDNIDAAFRDIVTGIRRAIGDCARPDIFSSVTTRTETLLRNHDSTFGNILPRNMLKKRYRFLALVLVALVILVVIFSFTSQNHVNPENTTTTRVAHNNATGTAQATATTQGYPSYLSGNGTLAFVDPLSQEDIWSSGTSSTGGACQFTGGAYHVSQQQDGYFMSCLGSGTYSNFALEVQLTITQGDCGGMTFRDDGNGQYYYFHICQNGGYSQAKYVSNSHPTSLGGGMAIDIWRRGQQNTIAVEASGNRMTFYINGQQIDQVQDNSYTSGSVGLIANPGFHNATDVAYTNARLWTL